MLSFHLPLAFYKGLFPVFLSDKILKLLLPFSILVICPADLNLLYLIALTILGECTNYEVPHCETLFILHSHPFSAQYSPQDPVLKF